MRQLNKTAQNKKGWILLSTIVGVILLSVSGLLATQQYLQMQKNNAEYTSDNDEQGLLDNFSSEVRNSRYKKITEKYDGKTFNQENGYYIKSSVDSKGVCRTDSYGQYYCDLTIVRADLYNSANKKVGSTDISRVYTHYQHKKSVTYSGGLTANLTLPKDTISINYKLWGGGGGSGGSDNRELWVCPVYSSGVGTSRGGCGVGSYGGGASFVSGNYEVHGGETMNFLVGNGGAHGSDYTNGQHVNASQYGAGGKGGQNGVVGGSGSGGAGGGATWISIDGMPIAVAGGGGGGGGGSNHVPAATTGSWCSTTVPNSSVGGNGGDTPYDGGSGGGGGGGYLGGLGGRYGVDCSLSSYGGCYGQSYYHENTINANIMNANGIHTGNEDDPDRLGAGQGGVTTTPNTSTGNGKDGRVVFYFVVEKYAIL